jgi:hypothetical protein
VTVGLCGVATGGAFVKCNCSDVCKVFVSDNAGRIMGEVHSAVARLLTAGTSNNNGPQ